MHIQTYPNIMKQPESSSQNKNMFQDINYHQLTTDFLQFDCTKKALPYMELIVKFTLLFRILNDNLIAVI